MRWVSALSAAAAGLALAAGCSHGYHPGRVTPALPATDGWALVPDIPMVRQRSRADCGAAALTMTLARWRPEAGEQQVRGWLGPIDQEQGVEAGRLRAVARERGLQAYLIEAGFPDLVREVRQQRPVIVGVLRVVGRKGFPHYEVVVGVNPARKRVLTADPAAGWREHDLDDFDERWKAARRLALVVLP